MAADQDGRWQAAAAVGAAVVMAAGIVVFGWPTFTVLALYWLENAIIGAFTVVRLLAAGARTERYVESLVSAAFFTVHYGFFCLVHGFFVVALFGDARGAEGLVEPVLLMIGRVAGDRIGALVVTAMAIAAALDAWRASAMLDEADPKLISHIMFEPYGRIVVLHLVLIGSGFLMQALKAPAVAALLLVAFKLVYDLRRVGRRTAAGVVAGGGAS